MPTLSAFFLCDKCGSYMTTDTGSTQGQVANFLPKIALVIGANSAIAKSVIPHLVADDNIDEVVAISRTAVTSNSKYGDKLRAVVSNYSENSIAEICSDLSKRDAVLGYITVFNGILHNEEVKPEKRFEDISATSLQEVFQANAVVPLMWLAGLAPLLKHDSRCRIAVLSARVGSIEDNRSGGWYAYRGSKAALNMMLRTAAIELRRRAPNVTLIAFHPGTTDTALSKPFQKFVAEGKLFEPDFVAKALLTLMEKLEPADEARFFDWNERQIPW